jgi:Ca2+-binding EF-hand superfamily protein
MQTFLQVREDPEIKEALGKLMGHIGDRAGLKALETLFKEIDEDGSGSLSYEEFEHGLRSHGVELTPKDIHNLIRSLDANADGELSLEEFMTIGKAELEVAQLDADMENYKFASKEEEQRVRHLHAQTIAAVHGGARFQRTASTQMDVKKQADLSMMTPFALQKRMEHKRNPKVKNALEKWWDSIVDFSIGYKDTEADGKKVLKLEQWTTLCVALVRKLDPEVNEEEAYEAAEDEWEDDKNDDEDYMDFEHFYEAMYTLTDTWVDDLDVAKYQEFIETAETTHASAEKQRLNMAKKPKESRKKGNAAKVAGESKRNKVGRRGSLVKLLGLNGKRSSLTGCDELEESETEPESNIWGGSLHLVGNQNEVKKKTKGRSPSQQAAYQKAVKAAEAAAELALQNAIAEGQAKGEVNREAEKGEAEGEAEKRQGQMYDGRRWSELTPEEQAKILSEEKVLIEEENQRLKLLEKEEETKQRMARLQAGQGEEETSFTITHTLPAIALGEIASTFGSRLFKRPVSSLTTRDAVFLKNKELLQRKSGVTISLGIGFISSQLGGGAPMLCRTSTAPKILPYFTKKASSKKRGVTHIFSSKTTTQTAKVVATFRGKDLDTTPLRQKCETAESVDTINRLDRLAKLHKKYKDGWRGNQTDKHYFGAGEACMVCKLSATLGPDFGVDSELLRMVWPDAPPGNGKCQCHNTTQDQSDEGAVKMRDDGNADAQLHVPMPTMFPNAVTRKPRARPSTTPAVSRSEDARQLLNLAFRRANGHGRGGGGRHALASCLAERMTMVDDAGAAQSPLQSKVRNLEPVMSPHLHNRTMNRRRLRARAESFWQSKEQSQTTEIKERLWRQGGALTGGATPRGPQPPTQAATPRGSQGSMATGSGLESASSRLWADGGRSNAITTAHRFSQFVGSEYEPFQSITQNGVEQRRGSEDGPIIPNWMLGGSGTKTREYNLGADISGDAMPAIVGYYSRSISPGVDTDQNGETLAISRAQHPTMASRQSTTGSMLPTLS